MAIRGNSGTFDNKGNSNAAFVESGFALIERSIVQGAKSRITGPAVVRHENHVSVVGDIEPFDFLHNSQC